MAEVKLEGHERVVTKLAGVPQRLQEALIRFGHFIAKEAKLLTPVDTGRLRASIFVKQETPKSVAVGTNVKYAPYVELGHRAEIFPVRAKALRFYIRGQGWVFAKRVIQGRTGKSASWERVGERIRKPFLVPAAKKALTRWSEFFKGVFDR